MTFTWLNRSCCVFTLCSRVNFKVMLLRFFNLRIDTMSAGAVPLWIIFRLTGRYEVTGKKVLSHLPSFVWQNLTKAAPNKARKQKKLNATTAIVQVCKDSNAPLLQFIKKEVERCYQSLCLEQKCHAYSNKGPFRFLSQVDLLKSNSPKQTNI